jgi:magnesium chelatase subunit D
MTYQVRREILPFTAILGQDTMKKALILNAINPRIGGVLIRGENGTAKSTTFRALAELLPEIEVVNGCTFNCNPYDTREMCDLCHAKSTNGEDLKVTMRRMWVVDLHLGATEDRVVGSIDVEKAIKGGIKALEPGILAAANRGILYIDEVNLLDDHVADVIFEVKQKELRDKTHRAEIVIKRAAKTIAAFDSRKKVTFEDIKEAMELALPHRMRRKPFE